MPWATMTAEQKAEYNRRRNEKRKSPEGKAKNNEYKKRIRALKRKDREDRYFVRELLPYGEPCFLVYRIKIDKRGAPKTVKPGDFVGACSERNQVQKIKAAITARSNICHDTDD